MSDSFQFNKLYESVRGLGLPYEIKESGGSVIIKIASNSNQKCHHPNEKFRFLTTRTFNGSSNQNWRTPSFNAIRTSFPDVSFFRTTPPPHTTPCPPPAPQAAAPPPPPGPGPVVTPKPVSSAEPNEILQADSTSKATSTTTTAMSSSTSNSLESPEHFLHSQEPKPFSTSTPFLFNPFRCSKRQIVFPPTPNLLNSPSVPTASTSSTSLEMSPPAPPPRDKNQALINVMEAIYAQKHF